MSTSLVINGISYSFPELADEDWGLNVAAWAAAVTAGMLQKAGGTFTLTADADFGANYGLKSLYYKTRSSNIASAGQHRLARTDVISWRNQANGADLDLSVNASDKLLFNSVELLTTAALTDTLVTGKLLTGFISGSGTVAATDSILQAINKLDGNIALKLDTSSFSDSGVTSKLITGFVSGAGAVAASDTILQAINKLDGNIALKLSTASFTDAAVTGKLITGFSSGAGAVAATDTILQAINKLDGNVSAITTNIMPSVTMVWKDAATITVKAGNYYCGNAWLNLAADSDWSWTLDTGSEASSTWYYLYLANVSGTPTKVASTTAPTNRLNTSLSGTTYDNNIYLGAFYNDSSSNMLIFTQSKNSFFGWNAGLVEHTGSAASLTEKTILIPVTANVAFGSLSQTGASSVYGTVYGANDITVWGFSAQGSTSNSGFVPIYTSQKIWIATSNASETVSFRTLGWIDKWL